MKKCAVLVYDLCSNYEMSVALSALYQCGKEIVVFAKKEVVISEEGLHIKADQLLDELRIEEFDSLLLSGCMNLTEVIDDEAILAFVRSFRSLPIGAISSSPLLLLKAGVLGTRKVIAGIDKTELTEARYFRKEELEAIIDVHDLDHTKERIRVEPNLITTVGGYFVAFGLLFAQMVGCTPHPGWYGKEETLQLRSYEQDELRKMWR